MYLLNSFKNVVINISLGKLKLRKLVEYVEKKLKSSFQNYSSLVR